MDIDKLTKKFLAGLDYIDKPAKGTVDKESNSDEKYENMLHILYASLTLESLGEFQSGEKKIPANEIIASRYDEWLLGKVVREAFEQYLNHQDRAYWDSRLTLILLLHSELLTSD